MKKYVFLRYLFKTVTSWRRKKYVWFLFKNHSHKINSTDKNIPGNERQTSNIYIYVYNLLSIRYGLALKLLLDPKWKTLETFECT